jgi:serine/threonine protein kinase
MGTLDKTLINNLTKIFVDFEGAKEALDVYDSSGEIVNFLLRSDSLCSFMLGKHVEMKRLGSGSFGAVFSVTFPCMETQLYRVVVKKRVPRNKDSHGSNVCKIQRHGLTFLGKTLRIVNNKYKALDGKMHPINTDISYICRKENYSEYIIGVLTGQLYRNGMYQSDLRSRDLQSTDLRSVDYCINMVNVFGFMTCYKPTEMQYVFMQQSDLTLYSALHKDPLAPGLTKKRQTDGLSFIFMQVLLAMRAYQTYNISHNDLKPDNIFLDLINKYIRDTRYNGENLNTYKYLEYKFGDESFYLPIPERNAFIVKIGDWGQAVKYGMESEPTVGNAKVFSGRYDSDGFHIPNWFAPAYDLFFFLKTSKLHSEYLSWMVGNSPRGVYSRPLNEYVGVYKTVKELLDTKYRSYKVHPKEGSILRVCNISRQSPWL